MKIFGRSRTAIGIEIGSRNIKAAQLCPSDGQHHIAALSMLPRERPGQQIDRKEILDLKDVLRRQGFCGNDVVLAAPEDKLLRATLELPPQVSDTAARQIIRVELSRLHKVAPDSFEFVYWRLPPTQSGAANKSKSATQTIAVACLHEVADAYLSVFQEAGFNVTALDVHSAAAGRACMPLIVPPPAVTSLLNLGWNSTKVLLLWGRTVLYEKFISSHCIAQLSARLSEMFGLPEKSAYQVVATIGLGQPRPAPAPVLRLVSAKAEAVAGQEDAGGRLDRQSVEAIRKMLISFLAMILEELKAPFAYVNHQYPGQGLKRLLLIGDGAGIVGISQYFQDNLGIEVSPAAPSNVVGPNPACRTGREQRNRVTTDGSLNGGGSVSARPVTRLMYPLYEPSLDGCAARVGDNPALTVAVGLAKFVADAPKLWRRSAGE